MSTHQLSPLRVLALDAVLAAGGAGQQLAEGVARVACAVGERAAVLCRIAGGVHTMIGMATDQAASVVRLTQPLVVLGDWAAELGLRAQRWALRDQLRRTRAHGIRIVAPPAARHDVPQWGPSTVDGDPGSRAG